MSVEARHRGLVRSVRTLYQRRILAPEPPTVATFRHPGPRRSQCRNANSDGGVIAGDRPEGRRRSTALCGGDTIEAAFARRALTRAVSPVKHLFCASRSRSIEGRTSGLDPERGGI